jgi:hypothetical protein
LTDTEPRLGYNKIIVRGVASLRVVSARHWHNSFLQAAQIPPMLFNETPFHANLFAQKEGFVLHWTLRLCLTLIQGSEAVPRRPALALPQASTHDRGPSISRQSDATAHFIYAVFWVVFWK